MENPIKMDVLGVPIIFGNTHVELGGNQEEPMLLGNMAKMLSLSPERSAGLLKESTVVF